MRAARKAPGGAVALASELRAPGRGPGEFARRLDFMLRYAGDNAQAILDAFKEVVDGLETPMLLKVAALFRARAEPAPNRTANRLVVPKGNVRYVQMVVISFTGQPFSSFTAHAGAMTRAQPNGKRLDPTTVETKFSVQGKAVSYIPVVFDLATHELVWTDLTMGGGARMRVGTRNDVLRASAEAVVFYGAQRPSVHDLVTCSREPQFGPRTNCAYDVRRRRSAHPQKRKARVAQTAPAVDAYGAKSRCRRRVHSTAFSTRTTTVDTPTNSGPKRRSNSDSERPIPD